MIPDPTELGISREAAELYAASDVIDLHVDTFIWTRTFGYDLRKDHGRGPLGAWFFGQADLPSLRAAGVTGATWIITTNPWRTSRGRARTFFRNLDHLVQLLESRAADCRVVRTADEYARAKAEGRHAAFIGIQGANALDHDLEDWNRIPAGLVLRATLVHLTSSRLGTTSSPLAFSDSGLTRLGVDLVRKLDEVGIFVDLAHVSRKGFFDAVAAHDRAKPLIVTHTGVQGAHRHWRNLDDEQLRAIADTGGTVGVMFHAPFLGDHLWSGKAERVADHLEHIVRTVGEDHASLGSDWDGAIVTPRDMPTCRELPKLVQILLDRGFSDTRIRKILGGNFLRTLRALRG